MATYNSTQMDGYSATASGAAAEDKSVYDPPRGTFDGQTLSQQASVSISSAVADEDKANFFILPANHRPLSLRIQVPDLDTSTGLTCNVGYDAIDSADTSDDNAFLAASTAGQTAVVLDNDSWGTLLMDYTPVAYDRTINWNVETGASGTAGTGTLKAEMIYALHTAD